MKYPFKTQSENTAMSKFINSFAVYWIVASVSQVVLHRILEMLLMMDFKLFQNMPEPNPSVIPQLPWRARGNPG